MRQNTPHPRELKARHSKIRDKTVDGHVIHKDPHEAKDVRNFIRTCLLLNFSNAFSAISSFYPHLSLSS